MGKYQLREISVINTPTTKQFEVMVIANWFNNSAMDGNLQCGTSGDFQEIQNVLQVSVRNPEQVTSNPVNYYWPWDNQQFYIAPVDTGEEAISIWVDYYWLKGDGSAVRVAESRIEFYPVAQTIPIHMEFNLLPANDAILSINSLAISHTTPFIPVFAVDSQGSSYQYNSFYQEQPDSNLIQSFWEKGEYKQIELTIPERLFKTEPFPLPQGYSLGADCKVVAIVKKAS